MRPLAIIESDAHLAAEIRSAVESAGFRADCFSDGASALKILHARSFALVILDLETPGLDAFSVCSEAAQVAPVITLTSEDAEERCIRALESGADDCLCRPFGERELVARVQNVLRRANHGFDIHGGFDALEISLREMRVRTGASTFDLTRGEAELLAVLLEHAPAPLTVARIASILSAKRGTIESRIKSLRKKLGAHRLASRGRLGYELVQPR